MFHLFIYESFNFKHEEITGEIGIYFGEQLERARVILDTRNNAEISYTLDSLDWMLRKGSNELVIEAMASEEESVTLSRPKALKSYMKAFDLSDQESLPQARWADYFAALSLACLAEALYIFNYPEIDCPPDVTWTDEQRQQAQMAHACERAVEAMDAVCYAEYLAMVEGISEGSPESKQIVSTVMSSLGRKGKKNSLSPFDKLRAKLLKHYDEKYQDLSDRKAARILAAEFRIEVDAVLEGNEDPEHQIAIWIGKYRRGKISQPS